MTNPPDGPPNSEGPVEPPPIDEPTAATAKAGDGTPTTPPPVPEQVPAPPPEAPPWAMDEDATQLMPAIPPGGLPPDYPPPTGGPGDGDDGDSQRTRNTLITIIVLLTVALIGLLIYLLTRDGDDVPVSTTTTTIPGDTTTTAAPTTTTEVTSTTIEATTSTTEATTTTTTLAPTTTTTAETTTTQPAGSDTMTVAGNLCVAGWWEGGWQRATNASSLPVSGGESYQSIGIGSSPSTVTGGAPVQESAPSSHWRVPLTPQPPGDTGGVAVQTSGNLFPRAVSNGNINDANLVERTRELLASDIADPVVEITQVIQTDIDGDGVTDTAVAAFHNEGRSLIDAAPGSYGVIYVLKEIQGEEELLLLEISVIPDSGGGTESLLVRPGITGFADVNHDGRMELITSGIYYEGSWITVWEYVSDTQGFIDVLGCTVGA